jgi:hypothetical protein
LGWAQTAVAQTACRMGSQELICARFCQATAVGNSIISLAFFVVLTDVRNAAGVVQMKENIFDNEKSVEGDMEFRHPNAGFNAIFEESTMISVLPKFRGKRVRGGITSK